VSSPVFKQKAETDRVVSPRATGEVIPPPAAPAAARIPLSVPVPTAAAWCIHQAPTTTQISPSTSCKKKLGSLWILAASFSQTWWWTNFARLPWHPMAWGGLAGGPKLSCSSGHSQQITHDFCSPFWVAERSWPPLSFPHPASVPSQPWPLVSKEV